MTISAERAGVLEVVLGRLWPTVDRQVGIPDVITAAVRGSRSAGRSLTDRLAWLAIITTTIILSVGQLLVFTNSYRSYGQALHDVALTTITGEPLDASDPFAQVIELVLAVYSVVVFGTLAGALGAFFLSAERARKEAAS